MELIENDRSVEGLREESALRRREVADAEVADFSRSEELFDRPGDFVRLKEKIGTMEKEGVEIIGFESREDLVDRRENRAARPVEDLTLGIDSALRLDEDVFSFDPGSGERFAETRFRFAVLSVTCRVVEKDDAQIDGVANEAARRRDVEGWKAHAPLDDRGQVFARSFNMDIFHNRSPMSIF